MVRFKKISPYTVLPLVASGFSGLALMPTAVVAQEGLIEEIIVTARQREESLQDVPAAITAFTRGDLERIGVQRAEDFIRLTPGVSMVNAAEVGDTQVNIRGINGARDAENSFAYVVDGIVMTNPAAFNREYSDLQQIEIVKGPQGAIYGRNAAAGAIIVTTQKPGDELGATVKGSFAGDDTFAGSVTVSGPMQEGQSGFSLHADFRSTDGYYENTTLGTPSVDDFESFNIGGRLIFEPSDDLTIDVKGRYGEVDAASITFNASFALPGFGAFGGPFTLFFEDVNQHKFDFVNNIDPQNDQEAVEFSIKADWEQEWGTVTAWALYSQIDNSFSADGTSGAFGFFNADPTCIQSVNDLNTAGVALPLPQMLGMDPGSSTFGPYTPTACDGTQYQERNQEDISFEVRIASPSDQRLRWLAGLYYLNIDRQVGVNTGVDTGVGIVPSLFVPPGNPNPTDQVVWDDFDTDVTAVFGQLAYDASETVEIALAVRYDREDRSVNSLVPVGAVSQYIDFDLSNPAPTGGAPLNPGLDPALNPMVRADGSIPEQSRVFEEFQPKLSVTWDATDDFTVFGSWGVGFKSGGFNSQGGSATVDLFINGLIGFVTGGPGQPATQLPVDISDIFEEETSDALELGFKANSPGGRWQFEAAVFDVSVDNMQFFEFLVGPFGLLRVVNTIDEVDLQGFEIGVKGALSDWASIGLGYASTDGEIKANRSRPDTVGNESPYTPDYTANVNLEFDVPMSADRSFIAGAYWSMVGETWFHTVQNQSRVTLFEAFVGFGLGVADYSLTKRDSYNTLDLRVGVQADNWSVVAFGKNITDEDFLEEVIPAPEFGGSFIHAGSQARWGVEFTYNFN